MRWELSFWKQEWCIVLACTLRFATCATDVSSMLSCYNGAYSVKEPPFGACSGFRFCEPGHYCISGNKLACPAGRFGATSALNSSSCSGECPAGYYCPSGTIDQFSFVCGSSNVYCPAKSPTPTTVPEGYYSLDSSGSNIVNENIRVSISICEFGHFCVNGTRMACPAGRYGMQLGLSNSNCSGPCPAGFYCLHGSIYPQNLPCQNDPTIYCLEGSALPRPVGVGYYTIQSVESLQLGGGYTSQEPCTRGTYCRDGVKYDCPAGRYGSLSQETNSSCSGLCRGGFYCPAGSFISTQILCDATNIYCPIGSPAPLSVDQGHYTLGHDGNDSTTTVILQSVDGNTVEGWARTAQWICPVSYYCVDGIPRKCPPGRYGSTTGLYNSMCSGYCQAGYYCQLGSDNPQFRVCGNESFFCPAGSSVPYPVDIGYYTLGGGEDGMTRNTQQHCEPGYYCIEGIKYICPAGRYGGIFGETQANCSGVCDAGYYCTEGSTIPTQIQCGDARQYCLAGSPHPLLVPQGYYSINGDQNTRSGYVIAPVGYYATNGLLYACAAGRYGHTTGLTSAHCTDACLIPGYFCPTASTSPIMRYCGSDNVFCPPGTPAPINVKVGFYTVDYDLQQCPPGQWRNLSVPAINFTYAHPSFDNSQVYASGVPLPDCVLCPEGTYKAVTGDDFALCLSCGDIRQALGDDPTRIVCRCVSVYREGLTGWFNISSGVCEGLEPNIISTFNAKDFDTNTSLTRYQQYPCEVGHYCVDGVRYRCQAGSYGNVLQQSLPQCSGFCQPGYFCPTASTSATQIACGDAKYYCPGANGWPLIAPAGTYTNEDADEYHRTSIKDCEPGYYCPGDGRRYQCAPGTYTDLVGEVNPECRDVCDRGYYCEAGSTTPRQFECGGSTVYCPRGSSKPTPVTAGFYCSHTGGDAGAAGHWDTKNATCSIELPCEPGYYCQLGIKYPCPPGSFGWRYGMTQATCTGLCAPGYYCPSYLEPLPQAPSYTVWPRQPQLNATAYICGDNNYYCPRGSVYPLEVNAGWYSIGGNADNRTRFSQAICPAGSYCVNSVSILCPPGRYGDQLGLTLSTCTAGCPAAFYCPSGTVTPIACPFNTYSTGLQSVCTSCPAERNANRPMLCQNENSCCTR